MFYAIDLKKFLEKILVIGIFALCIIFFYKSFQTYFPLDYLDIINEKAEKYNLPPELVCGIIRQESRFRKDVISKKGASGLMQIMEPTAYWISNEIGLESFNYEKDIFEPEINIEMGCWYIRNLINNYNNLNVALSAYNAGSGNVSKWLMDENFSDDGVSLINIPFPETQNYIKKVDFYSNIYKYIIVFK